MRLLADPKRKAGMSKPDDIVRHFRKLENTERMNCKLLAELKKLLTMWLQFHKRLSRLSRSYLILNAHLPLKVRLVQLGRNAINGRIFINFYRAILPVYSYLLGGTLMHNPILLWLAFFCLAVAISLIEWK